MIPSVYKVGQYIECVRECAESSMQRAVDNAKSTAAYTVTGEVMYCYDFEYHSFVYFFSVGYD